MRERGMRCPAQRPGRFQESCGAAPEVSCASARRQRAGTRRSRPRTPPQSRSDDSWRPVAARRAQTRHLRSGRRGALRSLRHAPRARATREPHKSARRHAHERCARQAATGSPSWPSRRIESPRSFSCVTGNGPHGTLATTRRRNARCENRAPCANRGSGDYGSGLAPVTEGWFVVNVPDAERWSSQTRGARCSFESEYGDPAIEFAQLGINVTVLEPGQTILYHAQANQEAFLVVSGECTLLVEGEQRSLGPWDFFHAAPWTEHGFVGAGERPCVIVMVGSRSGPGVHHPVSEIAARHGASVAEETSDWRQANGALERFGRERPSSWARL